MSFARTLVVGIGSPHGDDQAGWRVVDRLAADLDDESIAVRRATSPVHLLDWLEHIDRLILCDACRGLGQVGELRRWEWPNSELAEGAWSGTHDLSLTAALQLAERLGRLPQDVVIWSVEAASGDPLSGLSPPVTTVLPQLVSHLANEINGDTNVRGNACTNSRS